MKREMNQSSVPQTHVPYLKYNALPIYVNFYNLPGWDSPPNICVISHLRHSSSFSNGNTHPTYQRLSITRTVNDFSLFLPLFYYFLTVPAFYLTTFLFYIFNCSLLQFHISFYFLLTSYESCDFETPTAIFTHHITHYTTQANYACAFRFC